MDIPSEIRNPNIPSIPSIPSVAYLSLFRFGHWRPMSHLQTNQPSDIPGLWRSTSLFALSEDILLKQPVDFNLWGNLLLVNVDISWGQSRIYITSTIGDVGVFWGFGYPRIRYIQKLHLAKRELGVRGLRGRQSRSSGPFTPREQGGAERRDATWTPFNDLALGGSKK